MAKALLINFSDWYTERLIQESVTCSNINSIWNGGESEIIPPDDTDFIFVNANFPDNSSSSIHAGNYKLFEDFVEKGGVIISFMSNSQRFHLANLIGLPNQIRIETNRGDKRNVLSSEANFLQIFSRFSNKIAASLVLMRVAVEWDSDRVLKASPLIPGSFEILAYQPDEMGVVALKYKFGKGFYLFLPFFGSDTLNVMKLLIKDIFPNKYPELFEQPIESWTRKGEYKLPEIITVENKIDSLERKYKAERSLLDKEYSDVWKDKQEPYLKLITTQGDELKNAVASLFTEFGYYVIDVDKYFKDKGIENTLDEDLWLLNNKIDELEEIMKQEDLKIVEVKGIKKIPKDDDVTAITKYVRKRLRETSNPKIKGLFVVNHQMGTPANDRRGAFRQMLVENAKDAGELLISTNILFKIVLALKKGQISNKEIKKMIDETAGELIFEELKISS